MVTQPIACSLRIPTPCRSPVGPYWSVTRFNDIVEVVGKPVRVRSFFVKGFEKMDVTLHPW